MKIKYLITLCLMLLFLMSIVCVSASEDVNQTITDDTKHVASNGDILSISQSDYEIMGSVDNGTFTDLQKKIDDAGENSTIELENNYAYDSGFSVNGIHINKTLTIEGNGHVIDALGQSRIFFIENQKVILNNIIFKNGYCGGYDNGSAIYVMDNNFSGSVSGTFVNNSAYNGGAVYFEGNGNVINSTFENNTAIYMGGAIFSASYNQTVVNCTFVNNTSNDDDTGKGGAICFENATDISVINCTFVNNFARHNGASINIYSHISNIVNSSFVNNTSENVAAGLDITSDICSVINCSFENNSAKVIGGAACVHNGDYMFYNCIFVNSTAHTFQGGAIDSSMGSNLTAVNCTFVKNYAPGGGGAISLLTSGGSIVNCTFVDNYVGSSGSAVDWRGDEGFNGAISNCVFVNNIADVGGAVIFNGFNGAISNCLFVNNTANDYGDAGAIYFNYDANANVVNCTFVNNSAAWGGGAVKIGNVNNNHVSLYQCAFVNNTSLGTVYGSGGTIWVGQSADVLINDNWWGSNNPDWDSLIGSFDVPSSFAVLNVSANPQEITTSSESELNYLLYLNGTCDIAYIPTREIILSSTGGELKDKSGNMSNGEFSTKFASNKEDVYEITAKVDNEEIKIYITVVSESPKKDLNVSVSADPTTVGDKAIVVISGLANATGNITVTFMDENYSSPITGNIMNFVIPFLFENTTVVVSYPGDENYNNFTQSADIIVNPIDSKIAVILSDGFEGNPYHVNIKLPSSSTGNVTVILNDIAQTIDIADAEIFPMDGYLIIRVTYENLTVGSYNVTAIYHGDEHFNQSNDSAQFIISPKENVTMNISASSVMEGENVTIDIKFPNDAIGAYVVAVVDGKNFTVQVVYPDVTMTLPALPAGNYTIPVIYSGNYKYHPLAGEVNVTVNSKPCNISAPDVTKYFHGSERFVVTVTDYQGKALANKTVTIGINGIPYVKATDANGTASFALNLNSGVYNATSTVDNQTVNSVVTILPTVNGTDLVKVFRNATQFYATFLDSQGNYLAKGTVISFNINGVFYNRTVGENGLAKLNINLEQGNYIITSMNTVTGENAANNITVIPRIIENNDLTKYYRNASQYMVKIIGDDGKPVGAGETVTFNINGVFYTRTTNATGHAKLNINLQPGDYIITAEYKNCRVSNNVTVLPVLSANNLTKKYGTKDQFVATLVDGQGKAYAGQTVTFNINGVLYNRLTDSSGQAKLNINLMPGEYIITSSYNGTNIANKITVKS